MKVKNRIVRQTIVQINEMELEQLQKEYLEMRELNNWPLAKQIIRELAGFTKEQEQRWQEFH